MYKTKGKYESEVWLGLSAAVFILVFINSISLFIIYEARTEKQDEVALAFSSAALSISRHVQEEYPKPISESSLEELKRQYGLFRLEMVPSRPTGDSQSERRNWILSLADHVPAGGLVPMADRIFDADLNRPTRGDGDEYFYLYPVPAGAGQTLLIISRRQPTLAYLDDAGRTILIVGMVALLLAAFLFLLLSKRIFAPFRKIRETAERAGRPIVDSSGNVEQVVSEYERIIDECKRTEDELRQMHAQSQKRADSLEQFNQYVLQAIDSGMVTLSPDGLVTSVNSAASQILQIDGAAMTCKPYTALFKSSNSILGEIQSALSGANTEYSEHEFPIGERRSAVLGLTLSAIRDSHARQMGLSVLINDLTELAQLRRQVELGNTLNALGEMAGGLAHQIRNSLGVMAGYARLIGKQLSQYGGSVDPIEALDKELSMAEEMINQFLSFAKPFHFSPQLVRVNEIIHELVESMRVRPDCRHIHIKHSCSADLQMMLDPLLIRQALVNVLENAVKAYDGKDGVVSLNCQLSSDGLDIRIADFGCGIADVSLDQIFTPFYSTRASGTGLGLPLARKFIDLHAGRIELESTVGKGTEFLIHLPLGMTTRPDKAGVASAETS
ncbi:MAG: ATP-binding protein [candidate division Zixibacteria bacterium]